jgi:hypothetical protein
VPTWFTHIHPHQSCNDDRERFDGGLAPTIIRPIAHRRDKNLADLEMWSKQLFKKMHRTSNCRKKLGIWGHDGNIPTLEPMPLLLPLCLRSIARASDAVIRSAGTEFTTNPAVET